MLRSGRCSASGEATTVPVLENFPEVIHSIGIIISFFAKTSLNLYSRSGTFTSSVALI